MSDEATLVDLLRASELTNGSISLRRINGGGWSAVVCHTNGHMVHPYDDQRDDPVEALRVALIEDERLCRDLRRRFAEATTYGHAGMRPLIEAMPLLDPDFDAEDCLG